MKIDFGRPVEEISTEIVRLDVLTPNMWQSSYTRSRTAGSTHLDWQDILKARSKCANPERVAIKLYPV